MITIITVHLNEIDDLLATARSIQNQTYQSFNWFLIDGGSVSGVRKKFSKITRLDRIISEKDDGIYDAMNKGLTLINPNEYVMFLNSGDKLYEETTLEKAVETGLLGKVDVLYGNAEINNKIKISRNPLHNFFAKGMPFCHQSCLVRGSMFLCEKFNMKYRYAADLDFFVRLFESGKKFKKLEMCLVSFQSGGVSDLERIPVLYEWRKILGNKILLYFLYRLLIEKLKKAF